MTMEKPKRTYSGAGEQNAQARIEAVRFWDEHDDYLVPVKTISIVLGIRLQKVGLIPVERRMIDKRGYYRKGDVLAWAEMDKKQPDSLLLKLQEEHKRAQDRIKRQPSRRYVSGQQGDSEARQAREKSKANKNKPPMDAYEAGLIEHINLMNYWRRKK